MRGIYIHIPFCLRKCPYCDFYSVSYDDSLADRYIDALLRNFGANKYKGLQADTVYLGGGTPSALSIPQLERIIKGVFGSFDIANSAEVTIEANPCSVSYDKLKAMREMGFDRISFGIQSADDSELRFLGRLHDRDTALRAVNDACKAGFENISADVMLGLAGQTVSGLMNTADSLISLELSHVSAYMLKIEQGTPFDNIKIREKIADDELMSELYLSLVERLEKNGFYQYEISNFSKPGHESRHNLKYWTGEEYIGFGAAAHSLFEGQRYFVPSNIKEYILSPLQTELPEEEPYSEREEYIMLALRLKSGLEKEKLISLYGQESTDKLLSLAGLYEKNGLCTVNSGRVSLTPRGFLVSNAIIMEFLSCVGLA